MIILTNSQTSIIFQNLLLKKERKKGEYSEREEKFLRLVFLIRLLLSSFSPIPTLLTLLM